jgi:hypothetical protein
MTETQANPVTGEISEVSDPFQLDLYGGADLTDLLSQADFVKGARLVKTAELVDKAFIITEVHFYPGLSASGFCAACMATRILSTKEGAKAGESVVFNDGSTGIGRQIVAYLTSKGLVDPGEGPESGEAGQSRYDRGPDKWLKASFGNGVTVEGKGKAQTMVELAKEVGFSTKLVAPRGVRVSTYEFKGQDAETFYLG